MAVRYGKKSLSLNAAIRIITRGERLGAGEAWRTIYKQGLPACHTYFSGSLVSLHPLSGDPPPRWTARRRRLLKAYGVGGALAHLLNTAPSIFVEEIIKKARHGLEIALEMAKATKLFQSEEMKSVRALLSAPEPHEETMLFDSQKFRMIKCEVGKHWFLWGPRDVSVCPVHRVTQYMRRLRGPKTKVKPNKE